MPLPSSSSQSSSRHHHRHCHCLSMAFLSSATTHRTYSFSCIAPTAEDVSTAQETGALQLRHSPREEANDVGSCSLLTEGLLGHAGLRGRRRASDFVSRKQKLAAPSTPRRTDRGKKCLPDHKRGRIALPLDGSPSSLQDCLELLERMDEEGTLDMNKVSHDKVFNVCKRHRAVKEAFRFTKLIPRPSLRTYNQLISVCASAKDVEGAFEVLSLIEKEGLEADCILCTTLISACAKAGKIDLAFQVFHDMLKKGLEPNIHTYGALIDGCARAGQVGKAFGAYGIMRSKKLKPDRVIFNSLISACGRSGAIERAFDVLAEMNAEPIPVQPNHVTVGALIKACTKAGQVERALEVYRMMEEKKIKGSIEVYTEAVHACSVNGDLDSAFAIFKDLQASTIKADEVFFSALIDVAGHAKKLNVCFKILDDMKNTSLEPGIIAYSAVMGACSTTGSWEKGLEVYKEMLDRGLSLNISTVNALLTALCNAGQLTEAKKILQDMKHTGIASNSVTYCVLFEGCERAVDIHFAFELFQKAMSEGVLLSVGMCENIIGLCLQFIWRLSRGPTPTTPFGAYTPLCRKCALWAHTVYRKAVSLGVVPTMQMLSQLLGCLRVPLTVDDLPLPSYEFSQYSHSKQPILEEGFGIYDPRAFSLYEEAAGFGLVPTFAFTTNGPIAADMSDLPVFVAEVYILKILKALKYRHAAGARLPTMTITLGLREGKLVGPKLGQKEVPLMSGTSQAICGLLRSLRLSYQGYASKGKLRVSASAIRHWLEKMPLRSPPFRLESGPQQILLRRKIAQQQRSLRYSEATVWSSLSPAPPDTTKHPFGSNGAAHGKDSNGTCKPMQPLWDTSGNGAAHTHLQDSPSANGTHVQLLQTNGACKYAESLPVGSNGRHILDSIGSDVMLRMPSRREEIVQT